jgi:hypothetical protein
VRLLSPSYAQYKAAAAMGFGEAIAYPIAKALYVAVGDRETFVLAGTGALGLVHLIVRFMRKRNAPWS